MPGEQGGTYLFFSGRRLQCLIEGVHFGVFKSEDPLEFVIVDSQDVG